MSDDAVLANLMRRFVTEASYAEWYTRVDDYADGSTVNDLVLDDTIEITDAEMAALDRARP